MTSAEFDEDITLVDHLRELRDTLIRVSLGVGAGLLFGLLMMDDLIVFLKHPVEAVQAALPDAPVNMAMLRPAEFFVTKLKAAFLFGFVVSLPNTMWQIWRFIAPGLYQNEQRKASLFVGLSSIAFVLGGWLAYDYAFEFFFRFFVGDAQKAGIAVTLSVDAVYQFLIRIVFVFGFVFQTPMIVFVLVRAEIVESETIRRSRGLLFIGGLILGAVLTPPDVISQIVVASLLIIFLEIGMWAAVMTMPKKSNSTSDN